MAISAGCVSNMAAGSPQSIKEDPEEICKATSEPQNRLCQIPLVAQVPEASSGSGENSTSPLHRRRHRGLLAVVIYCSAQYCPSGHTNSHPHQYFIGLTFVVVNKVCSHGPGSFLLSPYQLQGWVVFTTSQEPGSISTVKAWRQRPYLPMLPTAWR